MTGAVAWLPTTQNMDTLSAFAMGEANHGKEMKVFDWIKAAKLIKEHKADYAVAGLASDMEYTSGTILENGKPTDGYGCFLSSTWATPVIVINGDEIDCYRMESELPGWGAETVWPPEALAELNTIDG